MCLVFNSVWFIAYLTQLELWLSLYHFKNLIKLLYGLKNDYNMKQTTCNNPEKKSIWLV